jgi:hypothetical protein
MNKVFNLIKRALLSWIICLPIIFGLATYISYNYLTYNNYCTGIKNKSIEIANKIAFTEIIQKKTLEPAAQKVAYYLTKATSVSELELQIEKTIQNLFQTKW